MASIEAVKEKAAIWVFCSTSRKVVFWLVFDFADDVEDLAHKQRRQPQRRFIEEQELRPRHKRAADHQHLLLAAAQVACGLVAARHQDGK